MKVSLALAALAAITSGALSIDVSSSGLDDPKVSKGKEHRLRLSPNHRGASSSTARTGVANGRGRALKGTTKSTTPPGPPPPNDECTAAVVIAWPKKDQPTTVGGTTIDSTDEDPAIVPEVCDTGTNRGVWYSLTVPNNSKGLITLSTCNQADYDTKISIFRALDADADSCSGGLECVAGQDDADGCADFTTELGDLDLDHPLTYYILVHGFGRIGQTGTFDLTVSLVTFAQCVQECKEANEDAKNAAQFCHNLEGLYGRDFNECMKQTKQEFQCGPGGTNGIGRACRNDCSFVRFSDLSCGDCLIENGSVGCTNAECQDTVCSFEPYCCEVEWDAGCVSEAFFECPCAWE